MKKENLFAGLYLTSIYAMGMFWGYKIGKLRGDAEGTERLIKSTFRNDLAILSEELGVANSKNEEEEDE